MVYVTIIIVFLLGMAEVGSGKTIRPERIIAIFRDSLAGQISTTNYPRSARTYGREAGVLIELKFRKDGTLRKKLVVYSAPAGIGFEQAALELVSKEYGFDQTSNRYLLVIFPPVEDTIAPFDSRFPCVIGDSLCFVPPTISVEALPKYPIGLRSQGVGGSVYIRVHLDERGIVHNPQIYKSSGVEELDERTLKAALNMKFIPAFGDRKPVPVNVVYSVHFRP